ncbi:MULTISPECIES: amidohydrolase family protein [unclassified Nocardia]|uniref:amidohydrolase family protein n=1 Tax=unclassified Nocardia TaxID=2637762 RepID=UPI001CE4ADF6|nr:MULTISPECIES: amidohydrolase family protein [unclassified Nocardia]
MVRTNSGDIGGLARRELLGWLAAGTVGAISGGLGARAIAAAADDSAPVTVLTKVTVIDGTGAAPLPDATVVLAGDRILAVGRFPDVPLPQPVRVLELPGKYVIPGLWDMHTHGAQADKIFPPMHLVHGVTGIREMWGAPETLALRERIERGETLGPRIVTAGNIIDGRPGIWPDSAVVGTEAEARAEVRRTRADGYDFVKVYSLLTRESFTAIADEASRIGIRFGGHVPSRIPVDEAVRLGQYTVEHMYGMQLTTSARRDELYAEIEAMASGPDFGKEWLERGLHLERTAADSYSPQRAAELFALLKERGAWQCPTITVLRRVRDGDPSNAGGQEYLRYLPTDITKAWTANPIGRAVEPAEIAIRQRNFDSRLELLGAMYQAGVDIVAGTDTSNPYVFPGIALHEELEWLVRAGFSPMRALQAATRDAARCLGLDKVSGTVEPGKQADLVVLDANPLTAIGNTRAIHAVITRGHYLDSQDRERMLRETETAAREYTASPTGGLGLCCG